jgi:hypothetical protein
MNRALFEMMPGLASETLGAGTTLLQGVAVADGERGPGMCSHGLPNKLFNQ